MLLSWMVARLLLSQMVCCDRWKDVHQAFMAARQMR
ncbi:hypothetical protein FB106_11323 [Synechococcus sp. Ace-Pa]|nr:hypothetical protein FB106_11323 [Synechococcus sp. Ace-Pa]